MKKTYEHHHEGHRQRLKDKVREFGIKALDKHEVLELLLTYTIPMKDTNRLAHELIAKYKSLSNVLEADYYDLKQNKGVGEETALFLSMLPDVFDVFKQDKAESRVYYLNSPRDCIEYFRSNYEVRSHEYLLIVCLNSQGRIIKNIKVPGNSDSNISFDINGLTQQMNDRNVSGVVLFHTHPNGRVAPSEEDISTTFRTFEICHALKISLLDHLIVNDDEYYSFGMDGKIKEMYDRICLLYPNLSNSKLSFRQNNKYDYNKK